jgi:hypothetical protein
MKPSLSWQDVKNVADEWEQLGWLHKFRDQSGREMWEFTPLGRRQLGLPPVINQSQ